MRKKKAQPNYRRRTLAHYLDCLVTWAHNLARLSSSLLASVFAWLASA